jgi:hypothetical protein
MYETDKDKDKDKDKELKNNKLQNMFLRRMKINQNKKK